uniref:Uncharacterized protein n=1 Tax=Zea mays TaxID=4577 RepID=A0A804PM00_MAIZE
MARLRQGIRRLRCCCSCCFSMPRPSSPVVSCKARFSGSGVPVLSQISTLAGVMWWWRCRRRITVNGLAGAPIYLRIHDEFGWPHRSAIMRITIWLDHGTLARLSSGMQVKYS